MHHWNVLNQRDSNGTEHGKQFMVVFILVVIYFFYFFEVRGHIKNLYTIWLNFYVHFLATAALRSLRSSAALASNHFRPSTLVFKDFWRPAM